MEELKPCPFCGGEAIVELKSIGSSPGNSFSQDHVVNAKNVGQTQASSITRVFAGKMENLLFRRTGMHKRCLTGIGGPQNEPFN